MSVLKEKIAEAISKHVSLDDTYTYELTRVKSAFEVGTISLEDFEEWSEKNVDDLAGAIVCALQPQLNDNQKIVLEWLKGIVEQYTASPICAISLLSRLRELRKFNDKEAITVDNAYCELDLKEQTEVLLAFAQWGSEHDI